MLITIITVVTTHVIITDLLSKLVNMFTSSKLDKHVYQFWQVDLLVCENIQE